MARPVTPQEIAKFESLQASYRSRLRQYFNQIEPLSHNTELTSGDLDTLVRVAHRMAGSGKSYGMADLSRCGRALEQTCDLARELPRSLRKNVVSGQLQALLNCIDTHARAEANHHATRPASTNAEVTPVSEAPTDAKILLVDDDAEFSAKLGDQLSDYGYRVYSLDNVTQLTDAISRHDPVAILVDMDFYGHRFAGSEQVAAWRQQDNAPTPVIFMSAYDSFDIRMAAVRAGGNHFLTKPLNEQRLVSLLRTETTLAPSEPYRILIVDDDEDLLQLYTTVLVNAGYTVFATTQPKEALLLLEQEHPELVLVDVYMPDVDGIELGQLIRQHEKFAHIPILFISAASDTDVQLACARLANDEFISKPVEPWRLLMVVKSRVSRSRRLYTSVTRPMRLDAHWVEDTLTALPALLTFRHEVQDALSSLAAGHLLAVITIDIRDFHSINNLYGYHVGDRVIQRLAWELAHCLNDQDLLCRESGDAFLVMSTGHTSVDTISEKARSITDAIEHLSTHKDIGLISLSADLGIAVGPRDANHADDLIRCSETAMFLAKRSPASDTQFHEPHMQEEETFRFNLVQDIKQGLQQGQFIAVYQPIMNVSDNRVAGFEALARWQHPDRGLIAPGEFIPLMEQQGLIAELTSQMLSHALPQLAHWHARHPALFMSINLSAQDIQTPLFITDLAELIEKHGLLAHAVILEITETELLVDWQQAADTLGKMRDLGVRIALDDFGSGYSSLSYLNRIQADKLKIDRSFIHNGSNSSDHHLIQAMITMGQTLGMRLVAEGVETSEQLSLLRSLGCDYYQGFLASKPMLADEVKLEDWL